MKIAKNILTLKLALLVSLCLTLPIVAQQDGDSADTDKVATAELLKQIDQNMKDGEWSSVSELMTDKAWDGWCERLVVECVSVANIDIEFPIPGLDDAQDAIREALEEHGLDEIEIETPSIEIRMGEPDSDDEAEGEDDKEEAKKRADAQTKTILAALGDDEKRQSVVKALWDARKDSPFSVSVFAGKIEETSSDAGVISAKITPGTSSSESGDSSVMIQIMAPPVFIMVKKIDDNWKYAGLDEEKTAEAMKNFRPPMMNSDRTDF